jgi:type IV secretion system protein VirD4
MVVAIADSLWRARQNKLVTTYGSARWANIEELKSAKLFSGQGVFLGKLGETYLRHDGPEHVLAFAPNRSGKGIVLVIPTLLTWPHSTVIHDIKGANWQLTAGFRSKFSYCLLFNPADPRSARYDPLLEVRKGEREVRDAQNIADILVGPEPQCLSDTTNLRSNGHYRGRLRCVIALMLQHHANSARPHFR